MSTARSPVTVPSRLVLISPSETPQATTSLGKKAGGETEIIEKVWRIAQPCGTRKGMTQNRTPGPRVCFLPGTAGPALRLTASFLLPPSLSRCLTVFPS